MSFERLIAELLVKKPCLQLTKLPTVDTALPEHVDDDGEQCFGDLVAERVAAAPSIPPMTAGQPGSSCTSSACVRDCRRPGLHTDSERSRPRALLSGATAVLGVNIHVYMKYTLK